MLILVTPWQYESALFIKAKYLLVSSNVWKDAVPSHHQVFLEMLLIELIGHSSFLDALKLR